MTLETADDAVRPLAHIGMMTIRFPLEYVGQMHLNDKSCVGIQSIQQSNGGMTQRSSIDNDGRSVSCALWRFAHGR